MRWTIKGYTTVIIIESTLEKKSPERNTKTNYVGKDFYMMRNNIEGCNFRLSGEDTGGT